MCPDGGALLLSGTNGYLHLLTLKVTLPPLVFLTCDVITGWAGGRSCNGVCVCADERGRW